MPVTPEAVAQRYQFARELALAAGEFAFSWYQQRDQLAVEHKHQDRQDLVSRADREVEDLIRSRLKAAFPEDGFVGEEGGAEELNAGCLWVVDPIDGTSCFLNGLHTWCVAIAVLVDGEPTIGVICDPNHNELFHACAGKGAWLNDAPMRVHDGESIASGLVGLSNSSRIAPAQIAGVITALMEQKSMFIRIGSGALTTAWVAAGRLVGFYEPHMNIWDGLAGVVLVREAGGVTNDFTGNDCLHRGNQLLLANNSAVFRQLSALTG